MEAPVATDEPMFKCDSCGRSFNEAAIEKHEVRRIPGSLRRMPTVLFVPVAAFGLALRTYAL